MWRKKTVSVVLPTYREKYSIRQSIESFNESGFVDEIIVVDNNAEEGTEQEVKKTTARIIKEHKQGYGHAIRTGIKSSKGELIIVAEPDGSFDGKDVVKLLAYSDDFEMVFGSRTHVRLIGKGSDMNLIKRYGDVLLGRLVTILFLGPPLTDLGCTLRITTRKAWRKIEEECKAGDYMFATEWVLVAAKNGIKFIEIPINFRGRVGKTTSASNFLEKILFWGIGKFFYVWKVWLYARIGRKLYS